MHVSGDNSVTFLMSSDTSVILDLRSTTTHLSRLHLKRFLDEIGTTSPLGYLNPLTRSHASSLTSLISIGCRYYVPVSA